MSSPFQMGGWWTLDGKTLDMIATVIECCEEPHGQQVGHPFAETVRVLATLRRFLGIM